MQNDQFDSLASDSVLAYLFDWYAARTGRAQNRGAFQNCKRRVYVIYRTLCAWYGAGSVEIAFLRDPVGGIDSLCEVRTNADFRWTLRRNRTELEKQSVMIGGTGDKVTRGISIDWLVPRQPIDPAVATPISHKGDLLDPALAAEDFRRSVQMRLRLGFSEEEAKIRTSREEKYRRAGVA